MANLKDIRRRIASVKKTGQITKAMKLVAAAKLKRATEAVTAARPYQQQLTAVLGRIAQKAGETIQDPLLQPRPQVRAILVVVLTSDRGLCGGFNSTLLRAAHDWLTAKAATGATIHVRSYGRKGSGALPRRGWTLAGQVNDLRMQSRTDLVRDMVDEMVAGFTEHTYDEVWIISNAWVSTLVQKPTFLKVLPVAVEATAESGLEYAYEPGPMEIIGGLLPLYIRTLALQALLETEAGEYASRMRAMDSATRNANDMIDRLSLLYNRARQAAITTELIEIVSGASAL